MKFEIFKEEFVRTLFHDTIISKVKRLIKSGDDRIYLEMYDMSFRLFMPTDYNINLELLTNTPIDNKIEPYKVLTMTTYLLPIGFYTWEKNFLSTTISICVLKEYENIVHQLKMVNRLTHSAKIEYLDFRANALIGAFSMYNLIEVQRIYKKMELASTFDISEYDKSFTSNGIKTDIVLSVDGIPQIFMKDESDKSVPIGGFPKKSNGISCAPVSELDGVFKKLYKMSLLSAFKAIH